MGLSIQHPRNVVRASRIAVAALLVVLLGAGNVAVCSGWQASAQARMDCCSQGTDCPMRHGDGHSTSSQLKQSDADRCCASSERSSATQQTSMSLVAVVEPLRAFVTIEPPPAPRLVRRAMWEPPPDLHHVSTHVLLSVFVV